MRHIISPSCLIEPFVFLDPHSSLTLCAHTILRSFTSFRGQTYVSEHCEIHSHTSIGGVPQSKHAPSVLHGTHLSPHVKIFEHCSIHAGVTNTTQIGAHTWMLTGSHVGHDCVIGEHVVLSSQAQLAGHVRVGHHAVIGGASAVQQYCAVGIGAMIGAYSAVDAHVPPYALVVGNRARVRGINVRGLRRRGVANKEILSLLRVAKLVYPRKKEEQVLVRTLGHRIEVAGKALEGLPMGEETRLAREFLEFFVNVGSPTDTWEHRRAAMGVCKGIYEE